MKKLKKWLTNNSRLAIGFLLTFLSLLGLLGIFMPSFQKAPISLSGFDILTDCATPPVTFISLKPNIDSGVTKVVVAITNWNEIGESCDNLHIYFPGVTSNHQYLLQKGTPDPNNPQEYLTREDRRPLNLAEIVRDSQMLEDIIRIKPKQVSDFVGAVEFEWQNSVSRNEFEIFDIFLPFQILKSPLEELTETKKYEISLVAPRGYTLSSKVPEASRFHTLGDISFYGFDIDVEKTEFSLSFKDQNLTGVKDILLIIFSAILGIGLTLVFEKLTERTKPISRAEKSQNQPEQGKRREQRRK